MKAHDQLTVHDIRGPFVQFLANLQGPQGHEWLTAFNKFLLRENCWPRRAHEFPAWKTLKLGYYTNLDAYRAALASKKIKLEGYVEGFLKQILQIRGSRVELDLVRTTVAELGFLSSVFYAQVIQRVKDLGFHLCPPELVLALRLEYLDQPDGESLYILLNLNFPVTNTLGVGVGTTYELDHYVPEPEGEKKIVRTELRIKAHTEYSHNQNWHPRNKLVLIRPRA